MVLLVANLCKSESPVGCEGLMVSLVQGMMPKARPFTIFMVLICCPVMLNHASTVKRFVCFCKKYQHGME